MLYKSGLYIHDLATLKKYRDRYKVTLHKTMRQSGFEISCPVAKGTVNEEKLANNISRARSKIYEFAMCNDWDYFVTLTLDGSKINRFDLKNYHSELHKFLNHYNHNHGLKIKYLLIPEQHKNGAWHMHGLFFGIPMDKLIVNQYGYFDWPAYSKKFGYISLDAIKNQEACAKYITKYVSKDMASNNLDLGAHLYYCSKGLKTAELLKKDLMSGNIKPSYENDYVKVQWFESLESALQLFE